MQPTKLYFVAGLRNNFRSMLRAAITTAKSYGIEARILDIAPLIPTWSTYRNEWRALGLESCVDTLHDTADLTAFVDRELGRRTVLLFLFLPEHRVRPLWRRLQVKGTRLGVISVGAGPVDASQGSSLPRRLRQGLVGLLARVKGLVKPVPDFWVVSGSACVDLYGRYFRSLDDTCMIPAHSLDYERYRFGRRRVQSTGHGKIVFLDQGWFTKLPPEVMDRRSGMVGNYPPVSFEKYRDAVGALLGALAAATGERVVICVHPKADLEHSAELYPGFELVQGSTVETVAQGRLVVANSTTSIQYAVIDGKPLLLFTTDELDASIMAPAMRGYAAALRAPVVNADHFDEQQLAIPQPDTAAYAGFMKRYVRGEQAADKPLWDLVFTGIAGAYREPRPTGRVVHADFRANS